MRPGDDELAYGTRSRFMNRLSPLFRTALGFAVMILVVVAVGLAVEYVSRTVTVGLGEQRSTAVNEARGTWIQFLAVLGLLLGFIYTAMTYSLARRVRATEALSKAAEFLGDERSATRRAAGARILGLLAQKEPRFWPTVDALLSGFIREQTADSSANAVPLDIQNALEVIGSRPRGARMREKRLDLHGANLKGAQLFGANLERADLSGAHVTDAELSDSHLPQTLWFGAVLDRAAFLNADLTEAKINNCSVKGTRFFNSIRKRAEFEGTDTTVAEGL